MAPNKSLSDRDESGDGRCGSDCVLTKQNDRSVDLSRPQEAFDVRFPRAAKYHPDWVHSAVSGGANPLWLAEWLTSRMQLTPGMRVLDLGCGRALSSIFLRHEFKVQVWAVDLWFDPTENFQRVADASVADGVFPLRSNAHQLPFAEQFFDAIVSVDAFMYFGTDDLYLNYLTRFLKSDGQIGIALAGLTRELEGACPPALVDWWAAERPYSLHSASWWRQHWQRTGLVEVELADEMPDGWQAWLEWLRAIAPQNQTEISAVEADQGQTLTYVRAVARKRPDAQLFDPLLSIPPEYRRQPLLRDAAK